MDRTGAPETTPWCGPAPDPAGLMVAWNPDPLLLLALFAALIAGLRYADNRLRFLLAWFVLVIAFVSPLCAMTTALFSARALHHLLLISLAAPVLALSLPVPDRLRPALQAHVALLLSAAALVAWHVPAVYRAAWDSSSIYWMMQIALLLPAWAFWTSVFTVDSTEGRGHGAGAVLTRAVLIGSLAGVMGLIGAVLTFSNRLLYPEHMAAPLAWGIEPLADQQLAGLIMWVPGLVPLAFVAAVMARRAWRLGQVA